MPDRKLIVIGEGPDFEKIRAKAGPNISLLGYQKFEVLRNYMQRAKAFVFAAEEDFGIAPIEAQACGTPVIAFGKGATLETIRGLASEKPTGVFFESQTVNSLVDAVERFESIHISPFACRENAMRFSTERFVTEFSAFMNRTTTRRNESIPG